MDSKDEISDVKYLFNPQLLLIENEVSDLTIQFLENSNNFRLRPLCSTDYGRGRYIVYTK